MIWPSWMFGVALGAVAVLPPRPAAPTAPAAVVVATARGEVEIPVAGDHGHPALPATLLATLLPVETRIEPGWAVVHFAGQPFRFLLDAPAFVFRGTVVPLTGGAYLYLDTLFVPLQWLVEYIPRIFHEAYRWDPLAGRFEETRLVPVVTRVSGSGAVERSLVPAATPDVPAAAARLGLHRRHLVVVDPGHGGHQPGSPGRYLPEGVNEKDVTLAIARALGTELERRGIDVLMTRTRDVSVPLEARAPICRADCDLFVSIHVNSIRGRRRVRGLETYFFEDAKTADAARVAAMENEDLRYDVELDEDEADPLTFILKDLHENEYLRESALLAELVHDHATRVHPGGGRRVAQANFVVLRSAHRPAILVETGYASDPGDGRFLASRDGQRKLAAAIADGIVEYLVRYEGKLESLPTR